MEKHCIHCGAPLPEDAGFCPVCAKAQTIAAPVKPLRRHRPLRFVGFGLAAAILVAAAALWLSSILGKKPQTYEGDATLRYTMDGETYQLLLTFSGGSNPAPELESPAQIREGETYAKPSQLYILGADGRDAAETFLGAVTGCTVEASPLDGAAAMDHTDPLPDDIFVDAALVSNVFFDTTCGTNDIFWTLTMENGDTLRLRQRIVVTGIPVASYTADDADLTTSAALEAFLSSLDETLEPGTLIELQLPPVVYTEPVNLGNRSVNLYGTSVGETRTTFTAPVTAYPTEPDHMTVHGIVFAGQGGTGISVATSVSLEECTFTGWDRAAEALDGGWVGAYGSTFRENGVGIYFDSTHTRGSSHSYENNLFAGNDVAMELRNMPGEETLTFAGTVFSGNGADVINETAHSLDFSGATVE